MIITISQGDLLLVRARFEIAAEEVPTIMQRMLTQVGEEFTTALKEATPVGTGRTGGHLDASYVNEVADNVLTVRTTQIKKLNEVRYGTGIYGKFGHPIVPTHARAMVWPEAVHPYRSVRGQHAHDFVTPVTDNIAQYADSALDTALKEIADELVLGLKGA